MQGIDRRDELGEVARAVGLFRENGLKVAELTEAEKPASRQRSTDRARMMQDLQHAFDAAIDGDLSRRVDSSFNDAELTKLGSSINTLVETVDGWPQETGNVLGALAEADLDRRVEGNYRGSFLKLPR